MADYSRIRITVEGHVQGVGFRFFAVQQARKLNVTGWVRNCRDGSVEAVAEGEAGMLKEFAAALKRGHFAAKVSGISVHPETYRAEFDDFDVKF